MDRQKIQFVIIIFLLLFILYQQFSTFNSKEKESIIKIETKAEPKDATINVDLQKLTADNIELFKNIGNKYRTDKIGVHNYHFLYGTHLGQFRNKEINFLEIGLGCGGHGPGKSLSVWKEFMPKSHQYVMEFDVECAEPFRKQVKQLFTGDQGDLNLMKNIGQEVGHFDVVVDDGGHSRRMQVNSLIGLWPFISSGGLYIIEDMYHSFVDVKQTNYKQTYNFKDNDESSIDVILELIILFNDPLEIGFIAGFNPNIVKPNVTITKNAIEISKSLLSINCFKRACVLYKK